jgi:hypothetical protein
MIHRSTPARRVLAAMLTAAALSVFAAAAVSAHPHEANGQVIANGQNHGAYSLTGEVCGGDPAAYGLETAHHGPDSGTPGKGDGCYQLDSMPPGTDDENPAID